MSKLSPRIIHVQPALPRYRMDFFARLSQHFGSRMEVFYSPGSLGALTMPVEVEWAHAVGPMRRLPFGLVWQPDVASIPLKDADILVLSGNPRQLSSLVLMARAKLAGAKVVWWGHYWSSTSRRWRQLLRYIPMALADALLFYTDQEIADFENEGFSCTTSKPIHALNNGLDLEPILRLRKFYHADQRENALLFVGRLTAKAQLWLGLEALQQLGEEAPTLHVIGEGSEKGYLIKLSEDLGLTDKVVWHGTITNEASIADVANRCRGFVYPGEVGLSLIHAMGYGLPAVVHDQKRRHMPEIAAFRDGLTGLSFQHGSASSLAKAIHSFLTNDDLLNGFSAHTKTIVGPEFSTAGMAKRFVYLVEQMEKLN